MDKQSRRNRDGDSLNYEDHDQDRARKEGCEPHD